MHIPRHARSLGAALIPLLFIAAAAATASAQSDKVVAPRLSYTISVEKPGDKDLSVTLRVDGATSPTVDLAMPIWLPGVYRLQEYSNAVRELTATSESGSPADVTQPSPNVWRVSSQGKPFTVRYEVDISGKQKHYSKSQIDDDLGVIQAGTALLFPPAHREASISLSLELPATWRVATALDGGPTAFTAVDYDELVDSPMLFGDFTRVDFQVRGIPFAVVVDKRLKFDLMTLGSLDAKLAEAQLALFGSAPFRKFLFLYMVTDDPSGRGDNSLFLGLEHDESTIITINPRLASSERLSGRWLAEISSHELFHAWNVRTIKPDSLVRPDYLAAPQVRSLWLLEGGTSYYAKRFVSATLLNAETGKEWLFGELANSLAALESRESLETLSLDVASAGPESFYKLYPRGEATALLLDVILRADSDGRIGLDDVMRRLYEKSREDPGFREEDLPAIVSEVAGRDYSDFFSRYVSGREKLPVNEILQRIGWKVAMRASGPDGFVRSIREDETATPVQQRIRASILARPLAAAASAK